MSSIEVTECGETTFQHGFWYLLLVSFAVKILLVLADIFGNVEKETTMTMEATMQDHHIKEILCL